MKRFFALAALVLGLAACQTEPEGLDVNVGGEQLVTVNVTVPEAETRAVELGSNKGVFNTTILGDDNTTMRYILQVYLKTTNDAGEEVYVQSDERLVEYSDGKSANFEVRLVPGRDYQFVAWADVVVEGKKDVDNHYNTEELTAVTLIEPDTKWRAMDESRDAFTATIPVDDYSGTSTIDLKLTRPFAKVRVLTTDIENLTNLGIAPATAKATYTSKHYASFNAVEGKVNGTEDQRSEVVEYTYTIAMDAENKNIYGEGNKATEFTIFTDYFFANDETVKFTLDVNDSEGTPIKSNSFVTDINVKRNHLTTIKGNILTDGKGFEVKIEDAFSQPEIERPVVEVHDANALQDAINNAEDGKETTITLGGDIDLNDLFAGILSTRAAATLPIVIPEGKTLVLDLNGFNITTPYVEGSTTNHSYAFENYGSLTIQDSSEGKTGEIIARGNFNYGTMTLESGSIVACDGNGGYGVRNYEGATFVMNGGSISTSLEDDHQVDEGGYDATTLRVDNGAKATINGGTINNICDYTFAIDNYGDTTINGGEIKSVHSTVSTYGTMTIEGGSFTCNGLEGITAHALIAWGGSETTINGGTFDGKDNFNGFNVDTAEGAVVNIYGGKFLPVHSGSLYGEGTINVMGGEFFDDPSARVVEGYKAVEGNNVWTVVVDPVAQIGNTKYDTLQEAFEAGGEITLLRNVTLAETVILAEGQTVVLNLDGKTITGPNVATDAEGNRIHVIVNNGTLTINGNGTVQSIATNGGSAILNNGTLTLYNATIEGAPSDTATGTASYAVNTQGTNSGLIVNNTSISGRGAIGATNGTKVVLNGGTYHTPAVAWGHAVYANGEGTEVVVNGGTFSEGYEYKNDNWGMYQIYSGNKAKVIVKGGDFSQTWDCANGYDLCTASEGTIEIYGGTFADDPSKQNDKNFVAEGYNVIEKDNTYTVIPSVLKDGDVLDLGGVEYDGTITVEGNVTIKGDTKITTLKSTTGCTITIEDGKTLTLNNFSFGAKDNANAEYEIKGGTVTANYGFFQHGKYALRSNFETGYMYYSYGSDITVYGTFHSQGKGDGLDYVRGKLTIAKGGKSIHDKSLWVGQPANWGAMNASLVIEEGGYVQANSLSVYEGSSLTYSNDADLKYNSVTGTEYITKK